MVKIGDRIELIQTDNPLTNLKRGDKGTVTDIIHVKSRAWFDQIVVNWDNGSNLILLDGTDKYER